MSEEGLRARKKAQTRQGIREAAVRLFTEHGYHRTTVADIADAAGVSSRTFFGYFPTKESVLVAEVEPALDRLEALLLDPARPQPALRVLREWLEHDLLLQPTAPELDDLLDELVASDTRSAGGAGLKYMERVRDALTAALARDLDAPVEDPRPAIAAAATLAALHQATRYADGSPVRSGDLSLAHFEPALRLVENGLAGW